MSSPPTVPRIVSCPDAPQKSSRKLEIGQASMNDVRVNLFSDPVVVQEPGSPPRPTRGAPVCPGAPQRTKRATN